MFLYLFKYFAIFFVYVLVFIFYLLFFCANIEYFCSFFKECPHPDAKQRNELSHALGLEPLQIKFWFQNKRTQMKVN